MFVSITLNFAKLFVIYVQMSKKYFMYWVRSLSFVITLLFDLGLKFLVFLICKMRRYEQMVC